MIPFEGLMKFNLYLDACLLLLHLQKSILMNAQMVSQDEKEPKSGQMKKLQEEIFFYKHIYYTLTD